MMDTEQIETRIEDLSDRIDELTFHIGMSIEEFDSGKKQHFLG